MGQPSGCWSGHVIRRVGCKRAGAWQAVQIVQMLQILQEVREMQCRQCRYCRYFRFCRGLAAGGEESNHAPGHCE